MEVLGLEGLECYYEKLRGFVKLAKVRKPKFEGPKSNFKKTCKQQWPTSTCQHRNWPRGTHEGWSGAPLGQVMADNRHWGGRKNRKIPPENWPIWRDLQVAFVVRSGSFQVDPGEVKMAKAMGKTTKGI